MSIHEIRLMGPELWIASLSCLILLVDVFWSKRSRWPTYLLYQFTLIVGLMLTLFNIDLPGQTLFGSSFVIDPFSTVLKIFMMIYGICVGVYARKYIWEHHIFQGEYFILSLFSMLGMLVLISTASYLTLYLGLELLTLPLYALIAMAKENKMAPEASMKYFVLGAIASGMLLFGISLLYGLTGSFEMPRVAEFLLQNQDSSPVKLFAMLFILAGIAFKLGAVPFQMWIPDVYQGSPTSVTLFIATLPKLAGFGMAIRILTISFPTLHTHWQLVLMVVAMLSLIIGNVVALVQSNIKRLLGYSAIAHMGFLFLGLIVGADAGYAAALAYILIYTLMALGIFGVLTTLSSQGLDIENISDLQGLGTTQPMVALVMLLLLFSLAGIPPTIGFYAKFLILDALVNANLTWLAIFSVIFSVIGAFYYLKVIKVMYFESSTSPVSNLLHVSSREVAFLSVNGFLILGLGIYPAPLIQLCLNVMNSV